MQGGFGVGECCGVDEAPAVRVGSLSCLSPSGVESLSDEDEDSVSDEDGDSLSEEDSLSDTPVNSCHEQRCEILVAQRATQVRLRGLSDWRAAQVVYR